MQPLPKQEILLVMNKFTNYVDVGPYEYCCDSSFDLDKELTPPYIHVNHLTLPNLSSFISDE